MSEQNTISRKEKWTWFYFVISVLWLAYRIFDLAHDSKWVNLVVPILLVLVFGGVLLRFRGNRSDDDAQQA